MPDTKVSFLSRGALRCTQLTWSVLVSAVVPARNGVPDIQASHVQHRRRDRQDQDLEPEGLRRVLDHRVGQRGGHQK